MRTNYESRHPSRHLPCSIPVAAVRRRFPIPQPRSFVILPTRRSITVSRIRLMKILSLSLDLELSQFRKAALGAAGHEVTVITSEKEALLAVQSSDRHDVVLLCHHFPSATARQAVRMLRQHHAGTSIVY